MMESLVSALVSVHPASASSCQAVAATLLPWNDWQFWIVTAVFVFAVAWLLRGIVPIPLLSRRHRRRRRGEKKATLTISGKPVGK